jgi:hypothetical protein
VILGQTAPIFLEFIFAMLFINEFSVLPPPLQIVRSDNYMMGFSQIVHAPLCGLARAKMRGKSTQIFHFFLWLTAFQICTIPWHGVQIMVFFQGRQGSFYQAVV